MQNEEGLRLVTLDLIDQMVRDGVVYAEVRFAPLLHLRQGLTTPQLMMDVLYALLPVTLAALWLFGTQGWFRRNPRDRSRG